MKSEFVVPRSAALLIAAVVGALFLLGVGMMLYTQQFDWRYPVVVIFSNFLSFAWFLYHFGERDRVAVWSFFPEKPSDWITPVVGAVLFLGIMSCAIWLALISRIPFWSFLVVCSAAPGILALAIDMFLYSRIKKIPYWARAAVLSKGRRHFSELDRILFEI